MKSDHQLIEKINKGRMDAFDELYYKYREWVFNLAWRCTGNRNDALDVLQETFLYFLGKFPGFELTSAMTTFFYPVVKHISINIRNKNNRFSSENDISLELVDHNSNKNQEKYSDLLTVLNILPEELREILLMRFVDDMNFNEIAQALSVPVSTVKSRYYRALQTLKSDKRTQSYFLE